MARATNHVSMHIGNRSLVLDLIRQNARSRAELASQIHLTRAAISGITDQLLDEGIIRESSVLCTGKPGRNCVLLQLDGSSRFAFGVALHRTFSKVGLIDLSGCILWEEELSLPTNPDNESVLALIAARISKQVRSLAIDPNKVLGIGITAPGPLDYKSGIILNPPNFPAWQNVPVSELLHSITGYSVRLENLSNAMALEEKYFGVAKDLTDYATILINDGIGSGVVIHGKLYRGFHGMGNEIGHTTIQFDGRPCECGNIGCLEKYASIPALLDHTSFQTWRNVVDQVDSSSEAQSLIELTAQYLSASMVTAINLYDLEKIILEGEMCYKPEFLISRINTILRKRVIHRTVEERGELLIPGSDSMPVRAAAISVLDAFFHGKLA